MPKPVAVGSRSEQDGVSEKGEAHSKLQTERKTMITWKAFVMAVMMVESSGNDKAIGDNGASHGPLQIQKACVIDANEWRKARGLSQFRFPQDCYDRQKAEQIMLSYLHRYATENRLGRRPTIEDYARIWNGGPNGYEKQATVKYWNKVKKELED